APGTCCRRICSWKYQSEKDSTSRGSAAVRRGPSCALARAATAETRTTARHHAQPMHLTSESLLMKPAALRVSAGDDGPGIRADFAPFMPPIVPAPPTDSTFGAVDSP